MTGVAVASVGKGELNAALSGLGQLAGIVMPGFFWGPMFKFFGAGGGAASAPRWLQWGPGGLFFVSGGMFLAAAVLLKLTPKNALFL